MRMFVRMPVKPYLPNETHRQNFCNDFVIYSIKFFGCPIYLTFEVLNLCKACFKVIDRVMNITNIFRMKIIKNLRSNCDNIKLL